MSAPEDYDEPREQERLQREQHRSAWLDRVLKRLALEGKPIDPSMADQIVNLGIEYRWFLPVDTDLKSDGLNNLLRTWRAARELRDALSVITESRLQEPSQIAAEDADYNFSELMKQEYDFGAFLDEVTRFGFVIEDHITGNLNIKILDNDNSGDDAPLNRAKKQRKGRSSNELYDWYIQKIEIAIRWHLSDYALARLARDLSFILPPQLAEGTEMTWNMRVRAFRARRDMECQRVRGSDADSTPSWTYVSGDEI